MKWRTPVARGALLLMEAMWVYALAALVMSLVGGAESPSIVGVGLIVVLSYSISRLLQASDLELGVLPHAHQCKGMFLELLSCGR